MKDTPASLKQTPFTPIHKSLGARMVNFSGWEMPIQYKGVIHEHKAVRSGAGLFDVSHMGQIFITGPDAFDLVQNIVTGDLSRVPDGKALYTPICRASGGIIDDLLVYKISGENIMLCVNASNIEKDHTWLLQNSSGFNVTIKDKSFETAMLALQGPDSQGILEPLVDLRLSSIRYYEFSYGHIGDIKILLSRTGYTGEKGFELYFDAKAGPSVWSRLVESGVTVGKKLEPIGLAARDTLRLEMRYALYGNELSEEVTPLEAGLKWTVGFSKKNFIGKEAIEKQDRQGVLKKSIGFEMAGKGIPRSGYHIYCNGKKIGKVTSGTQSPSLGKGIGMGLVDAGVVNAGDTLSIEIRGKSVPAKVVRGAFVQSKTGS